MPRRRLSGKTIIHVNQHVIKANLKNGENNPPLTIKRGDENHYVHGVRGVGTMRVLHRPTDPLACGARVWIEFEGELVVLSEGSEPSGVPTPALSPQQRALLRRP